jgi:hypothetical protein
MLEGFIKDERLVNPAVRNRALTRAIGKNILFII